MIHVISTKSLIKENQFIVSIALENDISPENKYIYMFKKLRYSTF